MSSRREHGVLGVEVRGWRWAVFLSEVWHDVRHASLSMRRSVGFSIVVSLIVSIGVIVNVSALSVFDRLMFRPLPYREPSRLVQIHWFTVRHDVLGAAMLPYEVSTTLRSVADSFEGLGWEDGWTDSTVPAPGENPLRLSGVTVNALDVLGIRPVIGRKFERTDAEPGAETAVMLSHVTWVRRFGGSKAAISSGWRADGRRYRVVGVLPADFLLPSSRLVGGVDGLFASTREYSLGSLTVAPFARLKPGVSVEAAQAEVDVIMGRHPWMHSNLRESARRGEVKLTVLPLQQGMAILVSRDLWLVSSAGWLLLLVSAATVSTLMASRSRGRVLDYAIRSSLGATFGRIVRLCAIEAGLVCWAGAVLAMCGVALAQSAILGWVPADLRGYATSPLDSRIVGLTIAVTAASAVLAAAAPTLVLWRTDPLTLVRIGLLPTRGRGGLRAIQVFLFVVAVLGVTMMAGALTTVPPVLNVLLRGPGFDQSDMFALSVGHRWSLDGVLPLEDRTPRIRTILNVTEGLPHVERAAAALGTPFVESNGGSDFWRTRARDGDEWAIGVGLFETARARIVAGRDFTMDEIEARARVAILNREGTKAIWPGQPVEHAIGKELEAAGGRRFVVGVVEDTRSQLAAHPRPALFVPISAPEVRQTQGRVTILVRMTPGMVPDHRLLTARLNEVFPPNNVRALAVSAQLAPQVEERRFLAIFFGVLALGVLALSAAGVHAVSVGEMHRVRREMAIRMALGASGRHVWRYAIGISVVPVACGAVLGATGTFVTTSIMQQHFVDLQIDSWLPHGLAAIVVVVTALVAIWEPVRRTNRLGRGAVLRAL